ncbi:MAG: hypothetical protein ABFS24_13455 [Pseudomonadota bacterium]
MGPSRAWIASQATLFPERLDDYIAEQSAVRITDVFVDELFLSGLGFRTEPRNTGRPGYDPTMMLKLFTDAFVAIDGSKFKAVNNRGRNITKAKLKRRLEQIGESIARYLSEMESVDRHASELSEDKSQRLKGKIEILKGEIARLKKLEVEMLAAPDQQISLTDPDARSMATSGRGVAMRFPLLPNC